MGRGEVFIRPPNNRRVEAKGHKDFADRVLVAEH